MCVWADIVMELIFNEHPNITDAAAMRDTKESLQRMLEARALSIFHLHTYKNKFIHVPYTYHILCVIIVSLPTLPPPDFYLPCSVQSSTALRTSSRTRTRP
jgi:hypothetical protein